jgi:outer membrane protein OmpA-like peptidoglycan-associated protein
MRILITGIVLLVIWAFFSSWLYNDILLPVINKPVAVQATPDPMKNKADSLARIYAYMPKDLMIYFEFNSSKFKTDPQVENRIAELKEWLDKHSELLLTVTGNTDLVGTPAYNQDLGLKRAQVVQKYLAGKGIDQSRMIVSSKGKDQPVADYLTEEGRAKNRRTEVKIKM